MTESPLWPSEEPDPADTSLDTEAAVQCPHCGQDVVIGLDPGGGATQQYVEDCPVCCRPWQVLVSYDGLGEAAVTLDVDD